MYDRLKKAVSVVFSPRMVDAVLAIIALGACLGMPTQIKDWVTFACCLVIALRR